MGQISVYERMTNAEREVAERLKEMGKKWSDELIKQFRKNVRR